MEIQLTALLWKKSSFSPWLRGKQVEPRVTPNARYWEEAWAFSEEPLKWYELGSPVLGLLSGAESQPPFHIFMKTVASLLDGSLLETRKGPGEASPKGSQGRGLPYSLSNYLSA